MTTLADLETRFLNARQNGVLTLTSALTAESAQVAAFIGEAPGGGLALTPGDTGISLDGAASPPALTVTGPVEADWPITGFETRLHVTTATLVFTQAEADGPIEGSFRAEAELSLNDTTKLALSGVLSPDRLLVMALSGALADLALADLANFVSGGAMADYLPVGTAIFDTVVLNDFALSFGFFPAAVTRFSFEVDTGAEWAFAGGLPSLTAVTARIFAVYEPWTEDRTMLSHGGVIRAGLDIGRDYFVEIQFQGANAWEVRVAPATGGLLPSLAELAQFAGGEDLVTTVNDALAALGLDEITIDGVAIGFNAGAMSNLRMQSHMQLAGARFDLLTTLYPEFQFGGEMAPDSNLSLSGLFSALLTPADLPAIELRELSFNAYPGQSAYEIHAAVDGSWSLSFGDVSIELTHLETTIGYTAGTFSGTVSASLQIGDTGIFISADHPGSGTGWSFQGHAEGLIPIGDWAGALAAQFGAFELPNAITELTVERIDVLFNSQTGVFHFDCEGALPLGGSEEAPEEAAITLTIDLERSSGAYAATLGGRLTVFGQVFALVFSEDGGSDTFLAVYAHEAGTSLSLSAFIDAVSAELAAITPDLLSLTLEDALFVYQKDTTARFLFGLDIAARLSLSDLPLIGRELADTVAVNGLRVLFTSVAAESLQTGTAAFTEQQIAQINGLLPSNVVPLPARALDVGLNLSADMEFGGSPQTLALPIGLDGDAGQHQNTDPTSREDGVKWFEVQKAIGPIYFDKVGVQYKDGAAWFLLDTALTVAGLTLSLDGLSFGSPLDHFDPQFRLDGLGVDYRNGPVEIGGAFLHDQGVDEQGQPYDVYNGSAVIRTQAVNLSAIGSYASLDGHPSLFVYAVSHTPIGGPAFFFVTGLAAGFGYNRALHTPGIDQVSEFPLVIEAVSGSSNVRDPGDAGAALSTLQTYVPPSVGEHFLAVGVKFTSFKIIDSFALLTVSFGERFEVDVTGLSTLAVPPQGGPQPLAEAQLALSARFIPDEGFLGVDAQLTSESYILSRDCRLTGGFAFYSWFTRESGHEGDFVLTLGGYDPRFNVPSHYPNPPRLGFNWNVDSHLTLKGEAYCALTPSAFMAGGGLEATWKSGSLEAWFEAGAYFLIAWKPYHYKAGFHVNMGVKYTYEFFGTHTLSVDVGADLDIWGPRFSGKAHIDLDIVSFDVTFGHGSKSIDPIQWTEFRDSFLPDEVCTLTPVAGLRGTVATGEGVIWSILPQDFALSAGSFIPSSAATRGEPATSLDLGGATTELGVAPMDLASLSATLNITVVKSGTGGDVPVNEHFTYEPILKNAPRGLWGSSMDPSLDAARTISDAYGGCTLRPHPLDEPDETPFVDRGELAFDTLLTGDAFEWSRDARFEEDTQADARTVIEASIASDLAAQRRASLLQSLGIETSIVDLDANAADPDAGIAGMFVLPPRIQLTTIPA